MGQIIFGDKMDRFLRYSFLLQTMVGGVKDFDQFMQHGFSDLSSVCPGVDGSLLFYQNYSRWEIDTFDQQLNCSRPPEFPDSPYRKVFLCTSES